MRHIYLNQIILLFACTLGLCNLNNAYAQTANLRLINQSNCSQNSYSVTLQIQAADATSFSIGTSSIYLTYNPASLSFASYQAINFSPNNLCIANAATSWDAQAFYSSTPGIFTLTLTLLNNTFSCPQVTNQEWISIGTITFTILNSSTNPLFVFNTVNTKFNSVPANDGTNPIPLGTLTGISTPSLLSSASLTAAASACDPATNTYAVSGSATVTNNIGQPGTVTLTAGALSQTITVAPGASTVQYSFPGLPSIGGTQSVAIAVPGCGSATAQYTAPASCTVASPQPCGVVVTLLPGSCNSANNQFTLSGTLSLTNITQATSVTITNGIQTITGSIPANSTTYTFNMPGLTSDGITRTVTATFSGTTCAQATAQYTAPVSCTVAPTLPCGVTLAAIPGSCNPATNQFTLSGTLSLTNITQVTTVTITNGIQTITGSIPANSTTFSFNMTGLTSDGITRTVTATFSGTACAQTTVQYTAPVSCTVAPPCVVNVSATPSGCTPATNAFTLSGTVQISNGPASGILTVTSGGQSQTIAISSGVTTYNYSLGGLPSNGATGQVTASISGTTCSPITQTFTAPPSCLCTQAVITSASATRATCTGTTANSDASIQFSATGGTTYVVSGPGISQANPVALPAGVVTISNLPNPATTASYTITVYTATSGANCPAVQQTVTLQAVNCTCPPAKCVPIVADRIR